MAMAKHLLRRKELKKSSPFSEVMQKWLKDGHDTTLAGLSQVFSEKSFAIIFLLLMALPALPIPTGGVTHVTEIITMLLSLELIIGRKTIWLPKRWAGINVRKTLSGKAGSRLIGVIRWFERFSRQRGGDMLAQQWVVSIIGLVVLLFTAAAFIAPPFSGLDTLPALGVVLISLGLILEDVLFVLAGILIGVTGIGVELALGKALFSGFKHFF